MIMLASGLSSMRDFIDFLVLKLGDSMPFLKKSPAGVTALDARDYSSTSWITEFMMFFRLLALL